MTYVGEATGVWYAIRITPEPNDPAAVSNRTLLTDVDNLNIKVHRSAWNRTLQNRHLARWAGRALHFVVTLARQVYTLRTLLNPNGAEASRARSVGTRPWEGWDWAETAALPLPPAPGPQPSRFMRGSEVRPRE